jgi:hypothetical protein
MIKTAFPVLRPDGAVTAVSLARTFSRSVEASLASLAPWLPEELGAGRTIPVAFRSEGGATCSGFTVVGVSGAAGDSGDRTASLLVHPVNLPGAIPLRLTHANAFRRLIQVNRHADTSQHHHQGHDDDDADLRTRASALALRRGGPGYNLVYCTARLAHERQLVEQGFDAMLAAGAPIRGLVRGAFPYHVPASGDGAQSVRRFYDTRDTIVARFVSGLTHNQKRLHAGGVATCIGVAEDTTDGEGAPLLYWQVAGKRGAGLVPELSASRSVDVGELKLSPGGPHEGDLALLPEDLSRYCLVDDTTPLDTSAWLCDGLYGVSAGAALPSSPAWRVAGVRPTTWAGKQRLEMFVAPSSDLAQLVSLTDLHVFGGPLPDVRGE